MSFIQESLRDFSQHLNSTFHWLHQVYCITQIFTSSRIFDPIASGNVADATNGYQMMIHSHVEKDMNEMNI